MFETVGIGAAGAVFGAVGKLNREFPVLSPTMVPYLAVPGEPEALMVLAVQRPAQDSSSGDFPQALAPQGLPQYVCCRLNLCHYLLECACVNGCLWPLMNNCI